VTRGAASPVSRGTSTLHLRAPDHHPLSPNAARAITLGPPPSPERRARETLDAAIRAAAVAVLRGDPASHRPRADRRRRRPPTICARRSASADTVQVSKLRLDWRTRPGGRRKPLAPRPSRSRPRSPAGRNVSRRYSSRRTMPSVEGRLPVARPRARGPGRGLASVRLGIRESRRPCYVDLSRTVACPSSPAGRDPVSLALGGSGASTISTLCCRKRCHADSTLARTLASLAGHAPARHVAGRRSATRFVSMFCLALPIPSRDAARVPVRVQPDPRPARDAQALVIARTASRDVRVLQSIPSSTRRDGLVHAQALRSARFRNSPRRGLGRVPVHSRSTEAARGRVAPGHPTPTYLSRAHRIRPICCRAEAVPAHARATTSAPDCRTRATALTFVIFSGSATDGQPARRYLRFPRRSTITDLRPSARGDACALGRSGGASRRCLVRGRSRASGITCGWRIPGVGLGLRSTSRSSGVPDPARSRPSRKVVRRPNAAPGLLARGVSSHTGARPPTWGRSSAGQRRLFARHSPNPAAGFVAKTFKKTMGSRGAISSCWTGERGRPQGP